MSITRDSIREAMSYRLGDVDGQLWSISELNGYIQEGYANLVDRTGCLWATEVLPDFAFAFTHTAEFEVQYIPGGESLNGCAQFTAEFEREYADNANGPANHNHHWEFNHEYTENSVPAAVVDLPDDFGEMERSTWNTRWIAPLRSRQLEQMDFRYELNRGEVDGYAMDKDGIGKLRKWKAPSAGYVPYSLDDEDEYWGLLIQISDVSTDDPLFEWGDLVQVPGHHYAGDPWGVIVAIYKETNNMRIEYRRRAATLDDNQDFEIQDRYTVYVRHYALAKAYGREGDGQDLELAAHFMSRYEAGIARMLKRKAAMQFQKTRAIGSRPDTSRRRKPLAQLPWAYGERIR